MHFILFILISNFTMNKTSFSEGENPDLCQHITLIHATLGNDEEMDLECLKG